MAPLVSPDPTYGWPEHSGVGGLNEAALQGTPQYRSAAIAIDAVRRWVRGLPDGRSGAFPYRPVLDHYQSAGRLFVDPGLAADLRYVHTLLERSSFPQAEPAWLFAAWLPSTFDQDDGDYESFLGRGLLDDLHRVTATRAGVLDEDAVDASLGILIAALIADIALAEADALPAAADSRRQRRRTHAAVHALLHCCELAPAADGARAELDRIRPTLTDGPETPGLAKIARAAAEAVQVLVAEPVERVIEVTMLPITRLHDEYMFLRCVQIFESLYVQVVRRLDRAVAALRRGDLARACDQMADATARLQATPALYRVLTTMPREVFAVIRGLTDGRSANQSHPYRQVELMTAPRPPAAGHPRARPVVVDGLTLQEVFVVQSDRLGEVETRPVGTAMARLDAAWCAMKRTHWGITLKIIGDVPGTGGTSGASYLKTAADMPLFPLLAGRER